MQSLSCRYCCYIESTSSSGRGRIQILARRVCMGGSLCCMHAAPLTSCAQQRAPARHAPSTMDKVVGITKPGPLTSRQRLFMCACGAVVTEQACAPRRTGQPARPAAPGADRGAAAGDHARGRAPAARGRGCPTRDLQPGGVPARHAGGRRRRCRRCRGVRGFGPRGARRGRPRRRRRAALPVAGAAAAGVRGAWRGARRHATARSRGEGPGAAAAPAAGAQNGGAHRRGGCRGCCAAQTVGRRGDP